MSNKTRQAQPAGLSVAEPQDFLPWFGRERLLQEGLSSASLDTQAIEAQEEALARNTFDHSLSYRVIEDDSIVRSESVELYRSLNALGIGVARTFMWDGERFSILQSLVPDGRYGLDAAMSQQLLRRIPYPHHTPRHPDGYSERLSFLAQHRLQNCVAFTGQLVGTPEQRLATQIGEAAGPRSARVLSPDALLRSLSVMGEPFAVTLVAQPLPPAFLYGARDFLLALASQCASGAELTITQTHTETEHDLRSELDPKKRIHRAVAGAATGLLTFGAAAAALLAAPATAGASIAVAPAIVGAGLAAARGVDIADLAGWKAQVQTGTTTTDSEATTTKRMDRRAAFYARKLEELVELFDQGGQHGLWTWAGIVAAPSLSTSRGVADLFAGRASLMGNSLEPIRVRSFHREERAQVGRAMDLARPPRLEAPLGLTGKHFGSLAQSQSLPFLFADPSIGHAGVRVVRHLPVSWGRAVEPPSLALGTHPDSDAPVSVSLRDLTGHMLICGRTGSGKTLLVRQLLRHARELDDPIPFVFIDLAQSLQPDRWSFAHRPLWYEAGVEVPGDQMPPIGLLDFCVPQEYHHNTWMVADLLSNWLPSEGPLPLLLTELLHEAFRGIIDEKEHTWISGEPEVPSFDSLERHIEGVFAGSGPDGSGRYEGELRSNLYGAMITRLRRLASPALRELLDGTSSEFFQALASKRDMLFSLARSGSTNERCLIALAILTKLRQWLRNDREGLVHDRPRMIVVLDEAHILLRQVPERDQGSQSNIHAYAVRLFDELMAEIRQLGAAVVILDQSPALLAESVLFSTSNKVVFPLASGADMKAVGDSLSVPSERREALGTLPNLMAYLRTANDSDLQLMRVSPPEAS